MQPTLTASRAPVRQYSRAAVLALWAAAAVPMGLLAWVIAPAVAGAHPTQQHFFVVLVGALTVGLGWQFVLVMGIVAREQGNLRWSTLKRALWLQPPSDSTGRRGGRLWWWAAAVTVGVAVLEALPTDRGEPVRRSFGDFVGTDAGKALFHHNWGLFALVLVMFTLNTVIGEELLFRGLLLPRMRDAFGQADWAVNGLLFGLYHLHQPWSMPSGITTGLLMSYATRRWQSAWIGILAHSAQSVFFAILLLLLVVS